MSEDMHSKNNIELNLWFNNIFIVHYFPTFAVGMD
jgi:hypothetical protein